MFSVCPICYQQVLSSELEWHADNHFADETLQQDAELARQVALAPESPANNLCESLQNYDEQLAWQVAVAPESPSNNVADDICIDYFDGWNKDEKAASSSLSKCISLCDEAIDQKTVHLISSQVRSSFTQVEGGLMNLLRRCLESEGNSSRSIIVGHVDHYQSSKSEDAGWGCGWRNIQMLSSHLLKEREDARDVLFGGSGFVPDITSLQRWLEIAWNKGFDTAGSEHFNHKIYGLKKWIGTTECAALLRSFGVRARIVDFDSMDASQPESSGTKKGKGVANKVVHGPMDKYLRPSSCATSSNVVSNQTERSCSAGPQVLVDWVWNYFSGQVSSSADASHCVTVCEKTPLYFQHSGHSRTIVGVNMQKGKGRQLDRFSLLILDPGMSTSDLQMSLRNQIGWQRFIKRGAHTLKARQYQLCYVDPGVASLAEMEQLKSITSELIRF